MKLPFKRESKISPSNSGNQARKERYVPSLSLETSGQIFPARCFIFPPHTFVRLKIHFPSENTIGISGTK